MRGYALLGARARIEALNAERERIVRLFPELGPPPKRKQKGASEPKVLLLAEPQPRGVRQRRKISDDVKAAAVERVRAGEKRGAVARSIDVVDSVLQRWLDKAGVSRAYSVSETARENFKGRSQSRSFDTLRPVLALLKKRGALRPSQIQVALNVSRHASYGRIDRLHELGAVTRDGGSYTISDKGVAILAAGRL